jgi:predicted nucleic acid-binding Zn ribbon protein
VAQDNPGVGRPGQDRACGQCGALVPIDARGDARFCSHACRQVESRSGRRPSLNAQIPGQLLIFEVLAPMDGEQ